MNHEIMVYQAYDEETGLLTVERGALDTIPQNHLSGSVLYFADDFITVDPAEYVTGEIINVKTLTTTPTGIPKWMVWMHSKSKFKHVQYARIHQQT